MKTSRIRLAVAGALISMSSATAYAAQDPATQKPGTATQGASRSGAIDIINWDHAELRRGFSAEKLMDLKAKGSKGEDVGDVNDILVDRNGKVTSLIVSHGGVFGIGDKELRVPFNEVKVGPKLENVLVPIAKDNVDRYRIKGDQQAQTGEMKVSELLNDQVTLRGGARYGDVKDLIIGRDGQVKAIVAEAEGRPFAFPWFADAYDPAGNRFTYDYDPNQVRRLRPFNYAALGVASDRGAQPARGGTAATGRGATTTGGAGGEGTVRGERGPRADRG